MSRDLSTYLVTDAALCGALDAGSDTALPAHAHEDTHGQFRALRGGTGKSFAKNLRSSAWTESEERPKNSGSSSTRL